MIDYVPWLYNVIKFFRRHWVQNLEENSKSKDTETRKTKWKEDENIVLPKE